MAKKTIKRITKKSTVKLTEITKSQDDLKFEIDQLRKDKMVYALESISTTLAALLFLVGISIYLPRQYAQSARTLYNLGFGIAFVYWLLTVIGNTKRLAQIKKLEKQLEESKRK